MTARSLHRIHTVIGSAIVLTTVAEVFYLVVWGMVLFPNGNWVVKTVWALTCGVAMGAVIGALTLLYVEGRWAGNSAVWRSAFVVAGVGSYCTWLCSGIDARFGYFGGAEHTTLFVVAGVLPAVIGGLLYGWFLYGWKKPQPV